MSGFLDDDRCDVYPCPVCDDRHFTYAELCRCADAPEPGTPAVEDVAAIAARLKEVEAEKARERQAAEEKK